MKRRKHNTQPLDYDKGEAGLTPRGKQMPQTIEEWKALGDQYEETMLDMRMEIGQLKGIINGYKQKIAMLQRELDCARR